ncbi:hypothetical protein COW46_02050 [Candidatus Gracilibacteria bacterium CG17_big_fil_post_rev_8_21_14_2_50_48_13]|nr:MAG: hypothetical protein COW46_02050 [Candidatus Gracilibacteria bacterium CG17_big_fil_post_rev_8_21_14_2_50_48_13]
MISKRIKGLCASVSLFLLMVTLLPAPAAQAVAPGKRTFKVTAYYSPLPNQSFYLKGNYEAEKRLNGEGTHGASGRPVFPGMIAAPKTYAFGTKIRLAGLGVGTVTDRGGAIVHAGERGQEYDRIDVWMGYGEPGLRRALQWGVRTVEGEVLTDANTPDTIYFDSMSPGITTMTPQERVEETISKEATKQMIAEVEAVTEQDELMNSFPGSMGRGAEGIPVKILQSALKQLGYYKRTLSGIYDEATIDALLRFQIDKKLITGLDDTAAGYFGAKSRVALIEQLQHIKVTMEVLENEALLEDLRGSEIRDEEKLKQELVFATMPSSQMDILEAAPVRLSVSKQEVKAGVNSAITPVSTSATLAAASTSHVEPATAPAVNLEANALSSADVTLLKKQLKSLGFYAGETGGQWNAELTSALTVLQKQAGIAAAKGTFTQETKEYLADLWNTHVQTWGFSTTMNTESSGEQVMRLQSFLTRQKLYTGMIDGKYGETTAKAVLDFQVLHGLVADTSIYGAGLVGPKTVTKLNALLFQLQ